MPFSQRLPEQYPRRILLALSGLNPQVVTETLYALLIERKPSFTPTEIHLICTQAGAERAQLMLINEGHGKIRALLEEYGIESHIHFGPDTIHTFQNDQGTPLEDIRTPEHNADAITQVLKIVKKLTEDPECAIHASITGGRNTVSYYLGFAMSLYGRRQDRLSHVLVNPVFEGNHDFYYPPKNPEMLFSNQNELVNSSEAAITLSEIPFIRFRDSLGDDYLEAENSIDQLVDYLQGKIDVVLQIDCIQQVIRMGKTEFKFAPSQFAFYCWIAEHAQRTEGDTLVCPNKVATDRYLEIYGQLIGSNSDDFENAEELLQEAMDYQYFTTRVSRINRTIKNRLGHEQAQHYIIHKQKRSPYSYYGLALKPHQIQIDGLK